MKCFELIIFDCDGVLVDSERIANEIFATVIQEECGLFFSLEEMFDTFVGCSATQCMEIIEARLGRKPPPRLLERYGSDINRGLSLSVVPVNGIEHVLESVSIPFCVASSGSHEKMRTTLGKTGLLKYFDGRLFSTSDVARGKPFPDVYLHAAKTMGISDPSRCLVIEDSPLGVQGGVAAGMTVFGYAELMDTGKLVSAGAHRTFDRMERLRAEIDAYVQTAF
ncbi:MAG TPA: HAD family hydrolase [Gammaproteobacteria bacterium]